MNGDDYAHDLDGDLGDVMPPAQDRGLDISRMHTARLVAPEVVRAIAQRRQELARIHWAQAQRLRHMAGDVMQRFETNSTSALDRLDEWLFLQDMLCRTLEQEQRFAVLTRELLELEGALARQWDTAADMLREAANHEISAELLVARTYNG
jgi:hypothetical protein